MFIAFVFFLGSAAISLSGYGFATGRLELGAARSAWHRAADQLALEAQELRATSLPAIQRAAHRLGLEVFETARESGERVSVAQELPLPVPPAPGAPSAASEADGANSAPPSPPGLAGPPAPTLKFDREQVLADFMGRIGPEFRVGPGLRERVAFWFDVYSKWDSDKRIIHDSRHPWIVYSVVDVAPIIYTEAPRHRWLRNVRADLAVKSELARVRSALTKLARSRSLDGLSASERQLVAPLAQVARPGASGLAAAARQAAGQVRVQTGQRDFFVSGLLSSPRYLNAMERIFAAHGLPRELTRLPFVESSFNKAATSKVGASGIWQLMGGTGGKFLIVGSQIDERRSPYKATDAAARLLKENHLILYRSWPLAVTAWNHGPSGVRKAIAGAGSRDLATILERYRTRHFDFASSNFYCEFLAALHAEAYKDVVFGRLEPDPELQSFFVALPRQFRPSELMRLTGLKRDQFALLNPDLEQAIRRNVAIPRGYRFHIPSELRENIEAALKGGGPVAAPAKDQASRGKT
jgi:membrane-bound lytic murein transglycosylase D